MFLSIVVPSYRMGEGDIFPLLASIRIQLGMDWDDTEVVISHDGEGFFRAGFLDTFSPVRMREIRLVQNLGPGMARQAGLESAEGDYVMFCDADDVLHDVGTLAEITTQLREYGPDVLTTPWIEEIVEDGRRVFTGHSGELTWLHGKVFRRAFLEERDIHFHPALRVHEDTYFLGLVEAATPRSVAVDIVSYVWKYRDGSITRRNGREYSFKSIPSYIVAVTECLKEIERIGSPVLAERVAVLACYIFFTVHSRAWSGEEHAEDREAAEKAFKERFAPFWHYWADAPADDKAKTYNTYRTVGGGGDMMEEETMTGWLARLGFGKEGA